MSESRKNGSNTGRNPDGTFAPGNPGRPAGARHRTTEAIQALLDGEAEALTRKAIDAALDGDTTALRLCLERIAPPRKDSPVRFTAPEMKSAEDSVEAMGGVVRAVADGELTPQEGAAVAGLIEAFRRALETEELERRIASLERRAG